MPFTVSLLDYGAGNVRSVRNAIASVGFDISDISSVGDIESAQCIVFPGVGRFGECMEFLDGKRWTGALKAYLAADRPFLGICVGFQALFASSDESPGVAGLGVVPGAVTRFDSSAAGLPVPHMGWNQLRVEKDHAAVAALGVDPAIFDERVYFVHSFCPLATDANKDWTLTTTDYGRTFISAVQRGNVMGTQFHPEKSGQAGLAILKSFLARSFNKCSGEGGNDQAVAAVDASASSSCSSSSLSSSSSSVTTTTTLARRIVACLDVRSNDNGDLVVTKGDQYDVREESSAGAADAALSAPDDITITGNTGAVRNLGKPRDLAARYYNEGADEIVFLNITSFRSSPVGDMPLLELLRQTSATVFVPLTIGGGIRDYTDMDGKVWTALDVAGRYFRAGADKVSIGSDAVAAAAALIAAAKAKGASTPLTDASLKTGTSSIEQISNQYGAQAVVVSVDPRRAFIADAEGKAAHEAQGHTVFDAPADASTPDGMSYMWYQCTVRGGREGSAVGAVQLGRAVQALGAGELLCNCVNADGQKAGFELPLLRTLSAAVSIPVIASSGAGCAAHFEEVFRETQVTAALAAGIFHRREVPISEVKRFLREDVSKGGGVHIR
jgi:glutamine amidotransferase/cyclase